MKRTEKEELVGMLTEIFSNSQVGFLADYRGLSVADVTDLRRRLHEASTGMRVLKNRIAKIAIKSTPFEPLRNCSPSRGRSFTRRTRWSRPRC